LRIYWFQRLTSYLFLGDGFTFYPVEQITEDRFDVLPYIAGYNDKKQIITGFQKT